MSSLEKTFAAVAALPGVVIGEVFAVAGSIFGAGEKFVREGIAPEVEATITVAGRKVGTRTQLFLLEAQEEEAK